MEAAAVEEVAVVVAVAARHLEEPLEVGDRVAAGLDHLVDHLARVHLRRGRGAGMVRRGRGGGCSLLFEPP